MQSLLPALSEKSEPLRRLTHKDTPWEWGPDQDKSFEDIKLLVSSAPVLKYFDPECQTEGQGDASQSGLGFVLLQKGQPVAYSSRALTPAETRYSQIEKELLAQVFGLEKHHEYVYGREIVLWTDHKPLVSITQRSLATAPKRLQRLLLRLMQYDVQIKYMPGPELYLADTLSRAYLPSTERSRTEAETERIHLVDSLRISDAMKKELHESTARDEELCAVMQYINEGWPASIRDCAPEVRQYHAIRHELTFDDGIVLKGLRCVIPRTMRPTVRKRLHTAHTGIDSTLRRARECVYWPGISADLKDYISRCDACNTYAVAQPKEPLISHPIPSHPWQKVGCDIFTVSGQDYLCTVDYLSDYFEVDNLKGRKDGSAIISRLKRHFSTHGIPEVIMSDNGPPFNSEQFAMFSREYGFSHSTSSPEYPQSNGKVESAVKIAKGLVKKAKTAGEDFYMSLLVWRNTPTADMNSSPAQRMFGRRMQTNIPIANELLQPQLVMDVRERKKQKQEKQALYFNRHTRVLPDLQVGDHVRLQPSRHRDKWDEAEVKEKVGIRSYRIITDSGRELRRNRRHLRKTSAHSTSEIPEPNADDQAPEWFEDSGQPTINPHATPMTTPANPPEQPLRRSHRQQRQPQYLEDYVTN